MEILKFTIAAGETKRFEKAGRYIEVIEADAALSLFFFDENGSQVADAEGILSGLFVEESYRAFTVYSATAQTLTLMVTGGRGGSRRQPGNVRIINRVAVACQQAVNGNLAVVDNVTALLAPGANLLGAVVRSVGLQVLTGTAGASCSLQVFAAPSAPGSGTLAEGSLAQFVAISRVSTADNVAGVQRFDAGLQIEIPAGWGIYVGRINSVAALASSARVSFEVNV